MQRKNCSEDKDKTKESKNRKQKDKEVKHSYIYIKVRHGWAWSIALLLGLSILVGCDAENIISTRFPCSFYFNPKLHPGTSIETALNNVGNYTFISVKNDGIWHIYSTLNDGRNITEDIKITTDRTEGWDNRIKTHALGANNGIIIGLTNFQGKVAWDRQCPNCINQYGGTSYPLELNGVRQSVVCKKCKRTYSLETGAITEGTKGDPLMGYGISYKGLGFPVSVGN